MFIIDTVELGQLWSFERYICNRTNIAFTARIFCRWSLILASQKRRRLRVLFLISHEDLKVFCIAYLRALYWIVSKNQGLRGEIIVRPSVDMRISADYFWALDLTIFKLNIEVEPYSTRTFTDSVKVWY